MWLGIHQIKQLVELIQEHGGDVLKFAGDALIVAFGDSKREESLATNVLRATQCGLGISCLFLNANVFRNTRQITIL